MLSASMFISSMWVAKSLEIEMFATGYRRVNLLQEGTRDRHRKDSGEIDGTINTEMG